MFHDDAVIDYQDSTAAVIRHDARSLPLDDETVDLIVTSPPYFALRSYRDGCQTCGGMHDIEPMSPTKASGSTLESKQYTHVQRPQRSTDPDCADCDGTGRGHYDGQLGSEDTPAEFIDNLVDCMREWVRVLKPSGSMFVNLGDKSVDKCRQLLPHRFAIACIDQLGLTVRMDMVWSKPNGLPESVTDRVRASHEYWFHIVKSPRYFTGLDEIREPAAGGQSGLALSFARPNSRNPQHNNWDAAKPDASHPLGRIPGSVWSIPSEPLIVPDAVREARNLPDHFAAFPQEWPRRLILGFSPEHCCADCGTPLQLSYDTSTRTEVRTVRDADNGGPHHRPGTQEPSDTQEPLLQQDMLGEMDGTQPLDVEGRPTVHDEGIRGSVGAGQPNGPEVGLRDGASPSNGGTPRPAADIAGSGPPPQPRQGRQPASQPGSDAEAETRPATEATAEVVPVSELRVLATKLREPQPCPNCGSRERTPGVVADFFGGTGTTAGVARTLGRYGISNDLSADYNRLAVWRIWESGHFTKSEQRMWRDRQGAML